MWQSIKKNAIIDRSWSSAKLFMMQNYTDNTNGDVPLTVENMIFLISFEIKVCTCSFGKENKSYLINCFSLLKNIFIEFSVLKLISMTIM